MGPQLQNADDMIELIIKNKPAFEKLLDALENRVGARFAPVEKEDTPHSLTFFLLGDEEHGGKERD